MSEVRVGQVWQDNDVRSYGRKLEVERVEGLYVYCRVLPTQWRTRIALKRMRPTSTGYRLVSDAPERPAQTEEEG